jgi:hypothetical protein
MLATCPNYEEGQPGHIEFSTTAHVMQDWKVDRFGNFLSSIDDCLQVTHAPDAGNIWTCLTCNEEAEVSNQ